MHEISLVAELVDECERRADGARVTLVRVRYATTLPEAALRQAFQRLTADGPLAAATLELEPLVVRLHCPCGYHGVLGADDLAGHIAVCPACGAISTAEHVAELELAALEVAPAPRLTPPGLPGPAPGPRR